ncbi:MAG TPA: PKD domain-containing protein [Chitinophagaceae bacterium]|nr:PKD domain-containing protein [Chitinophagaceae bacterium]
MLANKNTKKIIGLTVLICILVGAAIWGISSSLSSSRNINANVYPRLVTVKDSLFFLDSTSFAKDYRWDFGDGNYAISSKGIHKFSVPGNYIVRLTINSKFVDTFYVTVKDTVKIIPLEDSVLKIDGPIIAMQFENLVFRTVGRGAVQYRWKFGENNYVDSKEPFVQYHYKDPGDYTILLYTDNSQYPARHNIKILPSFKASEDSLKNIDNVYKEYEDDFKLHLQQIADGNNFNFHYYYLLKKYLCNNEKAVMKINGSKINDFNSYCLGLQFDKDVIIQNVRITPDAQMNCIKTVDIQQSKKL